MHNARAKAQKTAKTKKTRAIATKKTRAEQISMALNKALEETRTKIKEQSNRKSFAHTAHAITPVTPMPSPMALVKTLTTTPPNPPQAKNRAEIDERRPRHWMRHDFTAAKPVNEHELTSLTALIMYVAHTTRRHHFRIERQVADRFNIPNVKCLPSDNYDAAIRYLVDQVPLEEAEASTSV